MLRSLCLAACLFHFAAGQGHSHLWDLAVAISDEVELLATNGTVIGTTFQQFSKLKALAFDVVRHQFIVSDMDQQNDTIYSVSLTKESETADAIPIVQDLRDDIQGLAIDPISDVLYWTDSKYRTVNAASLKDPSETTQVILSFDEGSPQDVAVDTCSRYLYCTVSMFPTSYITKASLNGSDEQIIISDDVHIPSGIAVDHVTRRLYWADKREGIYYRIESSDLDGKSRQVIQEGAHHVPFGVAISIDFIYWTDTNNNALWRKPKHDIGSAPEMIKAFKEKPMGLIAKNVELASAPDCANLAEAIKNYTESTTEFFLEEEETTKPLQCLYGEWMESGCKCRRGYSGAYCETAICHNFCMFGNCHLTSLGYTQCHCPPGYSGSRCEKHVCDNFCLNGGRCKYSLESAQFASCECLSGFTGQRCEKNMDISDICGLFCEGRQSDILVDPRNAFACRCEAGSYSILESGNYTTPDVMQESIIKFQNTTFIILSVCLLIMILIVIVLSILVCRLRRQPRVKKRIIVNKNVTPLTYRPQPTSEQCEITIENCCNMNVCETPCFEPPKLRSLTKKDEKKTLLANMEGGDDLY